MRIRMYTYVYTSCTYVAYVLFVYRVCFMCVCFICVLCVYFSRGARASKASVELWETKWKWFRTSAPARTATVQCTLAYDQWKWVFGVDGTWGFGFWLDGRLFMQISLRCTSCENRWRGAGKARCHWFHQKPQHVHNECKILIWSTVYLSIPYMAIL